MSFFPSFPELLSGILLYGALLLFLISAAIYTLTLLISALLGSPFVSSNMGKLVRILGKVPIDDQTRFYDLGSGDGSVVFFVAQRYSCPCVGIERNPILYGISLLKQKLRGIRNALFIRSDALSADITHADVVYLFLLPALLMPVAEKIRKECRKGTVIISHGFAIPQLADLQFDKLSDKPFSTYYYRLK